MINKIEVCFSLTYAQSRGRSWGARKAAPACSSRLAALPVLVEGGCWVLSLYICIQASKKQEGIKRCLSPYFKGLPRNQALLSGFHSWNLVTCSFTSCEGSYDFYMAAVCPARIMSSTMKKKGENRQWEAAGNPVHHPNYAALKSIKQVYSFKRAPCT